MLGMEEGSPGQGARMRAGRVVGQPQSSLFLLHRQSLGSGRRRESEGVRSPGLRAGEGQGQWIQLPQGAPLRSGTNGDPTGLAGEVGESLGLPRNPASSSDAAAPPAPPLPPSHRPLHPIR